MAFDRVAVDTSAIVAIAFREANHEKLRSLLVVAERVDLGAPNALEASMVLGGRGDPNPMSTVLDILSDVGGEIAAFDFRRFQLGTDAFLRYGKGRDPAGLNFGDCMAYALAIDLDVPLLFTGTDFDKTDVKIAR